MRTRTRWTTSAAVPLLLLALVALPAIASVKVAKPEEVGLSAERLQRIQEVIQRHIDEGNISGAVTAATRRGRLAHLEAHVLMDLESKTPMTEDAIFKIMSMTKPIVGVPHPVPWTHICAMPPGVAHTPRAPRSAFDTQASRDARSGCTAPRSRPRRRGRPRGSERFGRGSLAP